MPPLKETRLQIQERTAREIRNRTAARLEQLRPKIVEKELQREEESDEEDVVDERAIPNPNTGPRVCSWTSLQNIRRT